MSFFTRLRDAVVDGAKGAAKNKKVVGGVLSVVLVAAGVSNPELITPVATNVYCSILVRCDI